MTAGILDVGLTGIALLLAWRTLFGNDLFQSIVYFVALGLVVALAWVRLDAPDIAIAEAAIGAGMTGALLLVTWHRLNDAGDNCEQVANSPAFIAIIALVLCLGALLVSALFTAVPSTGLIGEIAQELPNSGVINPVTAVLLNFRSFDTLLEIGVLFLTLVAVRALSLGNSEVHVTLARSAVLTGLLQMVVPMSILIGAYLLWTGANTPGGAFQAGAVYAGALVLMSIAGSDLLHRIYREFMIGIGLGVFTLAAIMTYFSSGHILGYPAGQAGTWILIIEIAAAVSIAVTLYLLFALGCGPGREKKTKGALRHGH